MCVLSIESDVRAIVSKLVEGGRKQGGSSRNRRSGGVACNLSQAESTSRLTCSSMASAAAATCEAVDRTEQNRARAYC